MWGLMLESKGLLSIMCTVVCGPTVDVPELKG